MSNRTLRILLAIAVAVQGVALLAWLVRHF